MAKSVKVNYAYNLIFNILTILIPVITMPYVSRVLGATGIGNYNYTFGILSYFGIIAVNGTQSYAQREIARKQNDKYERSKLFWEIFLFRVVSTTIMLLLYLLFIFNFLEQYRILFVIQICTVFSWALDISWYFQGVENFKLTAIRNGAIKIIGAALILLIVKDTSDLWKYTLIIAGTTLLGNASMWVYMKGEVQPIAIAEIDMKSHIKGIWGLFVPVIAIELYTVFDKTMLGTLCNTTEVGYYSQAEKIIKFAIVIMSSLVAVLVPKMSVMYKEGNLEGIGSHYKTATSYIMMMAIPMIIGCVLLSDAFVPIFFGPGYEPVADLMKIESLLFIILSMGQLLGNCLVSMNKQKAYTLAVITAAIVNLILNYAFITFLKSGAYGVAIASVIAELISTGIQFVRFKKDIRTRIVDADFWVYILAGIIMGIMIALIQFLMKGIWMLIIATIVGIIVYFSILFAFKNKFVSVAVNTVLTKIYKK